NRTYSSRFSSRLLVAIEILKLAVVIALQERFRPAQADARIERGGDVRVGRASHREQQRRATLNVLRDLGLRATRAAEPHRLASRLGRVLKSVWPQRLP